jgi:hypothetical protein
VFEKTIPASSGSDFYFGSAYDIGDFAAFSARGNYDDAITQSISTVAGDRYAFSFFLYPLPTYDQDFSAIFGGVTVLSLVDSGTSSLTTHTYDVVATGPISTVEFAGRNPPGFDYFFGISVSAIPEPSTWAMMLVGFAGARRARVAASVV